MGAGMSLLASMHGGAMLYPLLSTALSALERTQQRRLQLLGLQGLDGRAGP